jgi:trigger factor
VFRDLRKTARIKGFRPGKAPRSILEKQFAEHARGEVLQQLVQQTLFYAIEQADLDIVTEPRLEPDEAPLQGASYQYHATVEIRPQVELKQVEGLKVDAPELPEPDEDPIERHLEQLRERQAEVVEEAEGVAAARAHVAVIDFRGTIDGEAFEGGSGEEVPFEIGADRAIPGFEDELIGLQVGDEKAFEVDFPEDYPAEEVAGKRARFEVTLKELKRRELPELDDEFAKDVSDFESLEDLRADLRRRVEEGREQERKRLLRQSVIRAAIEANPFPVPASLVHQQLHSMINRMLSQMPPMDEERRQQFMDRWHAEWEEQAERDCALAFLVPKIAEAHEIEISDEDVDAHLVELAEQQEQSVTQIKRIYQERGALPQLRAGLLEERVVEFLVSKATLEGA